VDQFLVGPAALYEGPEALYEGRAVFPIRHVSECPDPLAGPVNLHGLESPSDPLRSLMGPGAKMDRILEHVRQVADSGTIILIQGEAGAGKEILARAIHQMSARRGKPFMVLDCEAIPETLIESVLFGSDEGSDAANHGWGEWDPQLAAPGTLFLDQVAGLPRAAQVKLLRVLEERQVRPIGGQRTVPLRVRIIASCHVPLWGEVQAGRFRRDLCERLAEFSVTLPPLRDRVEDILYLASRFLAEAAMELRRPVRGIAEEAVRRLLSYPWPGNVRELRNVIRRAVLFGGQRIEPEHLPPRFSGASLSPAG
jgi:two-component system nitrogen regulation response regulator GlnG